MKSLSLPFGFYRLKLVCKLGGKGIDFQENLQYLKIGNFTK